MNFKSFSSSFPRIKEMVNSSLRQLSRDSSVDLVEALAQITAMKIRDLPNKDGKKKTTQEMKTQKQKEAKERKQKEKEAAKKKKELEKELAKKKKKEEKEALKRKREEKKEEKNKKKYVKELQLLHKDNIRKMKDEKYRKSEEIKNKNHSNALKKN